jgi:hypothetical protein
MITKTGSGQISGMLRVVWVFPQQQRLRREGEAVALRHAALQVATAV